MKTGYDQFFSQVKKNRKTQAGPETMGSVRNSVRARIARKAKVRAKIPLQLLVTIIIGLFSSSMAWMKQDQILDWLETVEVNAFAGAAAEEKPKHESSSKDDKKEDAKKVNDSTSSHEESVGAAESHAKAKDTDDGTAHAHLKKLMQRKKELDVRETELSKMEEDLKLQRDALDERIKELEKIRAQIGDILKDKVQIDSDRVDKLVDFYSNMKPAQAAKIMETMNEDLVVETLSRMKKKSAADIMNLLEAKKAQSISEKFAGYRRK